MKAPETLVLNVCEWVKLHKARGEKSCLEIGGRSYSPISFEFNEWRFNKPTAGFVMEFTSYFVDRVLSMDIETCPECRAELDKEMNALIIDAHGKPPKEGV